ncbi:hypothetical protein WNY51_18100 [Pseudocolwellia sp. AS88]|uniref:hypothetical protein n=1 Tax=Pseudocolwellia sp. AS88 TaxID=3063958 RepID=UPI0026EEE593|nr:hypothetical protein [Pseudocolwellia sp. AS88]MDO7085533.1 hypothetical protein [Pseudocolwellia sp. AS88]
MSTNFLTHSAYINQPNHYPNKACRSTDIDGESISVEGAYAVQDVSCNECGTQWKDTFKLTGFVVTELPSET